MTVLLVLLAIFAAGLITELVAANHAPFGFQDEPELHFGKDLRKISHVIKVDKPG